VHEFGFERSELHAVARLNQLKVHVAQLVLARLGLDERDRERGPDDRRLRKLAQKVRNAADVIFVPVGDEHRSQLVRAFAHVREVVDDHVHAEHLVVGKHEAGSR